MSKKKSKQKKRNNDILSFQITLVFFIFILLYGIYLTLQPVEDVKPVETSRTTVEVETQPVILFSDKIEKAKVPLVKKVSAKRKAMEEKEIVCLTANIYFESRGEPIKGQQAVAYVTMNRLVHGNYPSTVCKVVFQDKQFSWTKDFNPKVKIDKVAWNKAHKIAKEVYYNYDSSKDPVNGATHFYSTKILKTKPYWAVNVLNKKRIENHTFMALN